MLNLSLPPAQTPPPSSTPTRKRKRSNASKPAADPLPSLDERLEFFMDKLSMWQLTVSLAAHPPSSSQPSSSQPEDPGKDKAEEKDWTQLFCEDVVEPLYVGRSPSVSVS